MSGGMRGPMTVDGPQKTTEIGGFMMVRDRHGIIAAYVASTMDAEIISEALTIAEESGLSPRELKSNLDTAVANWNLVMDDRDHFIARLQKYCAHTGRIHSGNISFCPECTKVFDRSGVNSTSHTRHEISGPDVLTSTGILK